jgi:hypothetical protein
LRGERTALVKPIRGVLAEDGIVVPPGLARLRRGVPSALDDAAPGLPGLARELIAA